jgi:hypothetical protein
MLKLALIDMNKQAPGNDWLDRGTWLLLGALLGGTLTHFVGTGILTLSSAKADPGATAGGTRTASTEYTGSDTRQRRERGDDAAKNLAKLEQDLAKFERMPPGSPERSGFITTIVSGFFAVDLARGLEWLMKLDPAGGDAGEAASLFASRLASDRPEQWRSMLENLESGKIRDAFIRAGCVGLAHHGVPEAWETYLRLRDTMVQKDGGDWGVFIGLARSHSVDFWPIASGVDFISMPGATPAERFFNYARFDDASDALAIIRSLHESDVSAAISAYTRNLDPSDKLKWADALISSDIDSTLRDQQLAAVVDSTIGTAPGEAARITTSIQDPDLKSQYSRKMIQYGTMQGSAMDRRIREILGSAAPPASR